MFRLPGTNTSPALAVTNAVEDLVARSADAPAVVAVVVVVASLIPASRSWSAIRDLDRDALGNDPSK